MTEAELQTATIDVAHLYGWRVAFFRPARTASGWRTPVGADGGGWPDCVFVRERIIAVEFKSDAGKVAPEQQQWLDAFRAAGTESYVWRPHDLTSGTVLAVLRHRTPNASITSTEARP